MRWKLVVVVVLAMVALVGCASGASLSVTVDRPQGEPVRNSEVCLGQGSDESCAQTDDNGVATIDVESMPTGYYYLYVWNPGQQGTTDCVTQSGWDPSCIQVYVPGGGQDPQSEEVSLSASKAFDG